MKKFALLLVLACTFGCGGDDSVTIPENATAEAPDEGTTEGGAESEGKKGPAQEHKLKPR
ncbi:MAG: hypothetical protein KDB22_12155 [Planctomycetales bacterium]|nr:hypothetical protein [Planctomycetales bacterium]